MKVRRVLMAVGALFLAVGLGIEAGLVAGDVVDAVRMRGWEPVPAELLKVDLERHHSRRITTHEAIALYRYEVGGVAYEGSRVGISREPDNIGDYHEDMHRRLRRLQRDKAPLTVWVDPAAPAAAVIDRQPRWGFLLFKSLFGGIFIGVGILLLNARDEKKG